MVSSNKNRRTLHRRQVLSRNDLGIVLLSPLLCIIFAALIWWLAFSRINSDIKKIEDAAFQNAASLSAAYTHQLTRTIERIDQMTLSLTYYWKKTGGSLDLPEQLQKGLFPEPSQFYVTIVGRDGVVATSTLGGAPVPIINRDYFKAHQSGGVQGLLISRPELGRRFGRNVIRFTRALEDGDGAFDGIVIVGVDPGFLSTVTGEAALSPGDFVAARDLQGQLLATTQSSPDLARDGPFLTSPSFETGSGVEKLPGSAFMDGFSRIVAWQSLEKYNVYSYVGLAEKNLFASYKATAASYRNIAFAASIALLLFAMTGMYLTWRYILRKRHAEEVRHTFQLAVDGAREGFYMTRACYDDHNKIIDYQIEDCNERAAEYFDHSREALTGRRVSDLYPPDAHGRILTVFGKAMHDGFYEDEFLHAYNPSKPVAWFHRRLVRSDGGLAVTIRDISEIKAHEHELASMANKDALTQLPNRYWLASFLPAALSDAVSNQSMLAVLFIDLDNFKNINDSSGHSVGDEVLKKAALRLKSLLRPEDKVVRLGGDEFTVVLCSVLNQQEVARVAARITQAFAEPFELAGRKNIAGATVGISLFPQDGSNAEALLMNADIAMYSAKADGKGKFHFYNQQLYERIKTRLDTEQQLLNAIEEDQFVVYYQPRVNAVSGEMVAMEALLRWNHPQRGLVPPDDFISLAEASGLIIPLGELVMNKTCAQIAAWQRDGVNVLPVSVNVSARQFNEGKVHLLLASMLARHHVLPALLEVELTESAMMGDLDVVRTQMCAISQLGVRIHIDDFGTGYSSLSLLQELRTDVLKIDIAFTSKLGQGEEAEVFFKAIVSMAKAMGMAVIAEGVETGEQLRQVQALSCDELQGYLVSRAIPAADIPALIDKRFLFHQYLQKTGPDLSFSAV